MEYGTNPPARKRSRADFNDPIHHADMGYHNGDSNNMLDAAAGFLNAPDFNAFLSSTKYDTIELNNSVGMQDMELPSFLNLDPMDMDTNGSGLASPSTVPESLFNDLSLPRLDNSCNAVIKTEIGTNHIKTEPTEYNIAPTSDFSGQYESNRLLLTSNAQVQHVLPQASVQLKEIKSDISNLKFVQLSFFNSGCNQNAKVEVKQLQNAARKKLEGLWGTLETLSNDYILDPSEVYQWFNIRREVELLETQLKLYEQEIDQPQNPAMALIITKQPFPISVKQKKELEESVQVQIFTGAASGSNIRVTQPVIASVIGESVPSSRAKKNKQLSVANNQQRMNDKFCATFTGLKFPEGTRKKVIRVKFSGTVQVTLPNGNIQDILLDSAPTAPIIVKTNENQWDEAEGILLNKLVFGDSEQVSWCRFCNILQHRYLQATKQDPQNPERPLYLPDFNYMFQCRFGGEDCTSVPVRETLITTKQYTRFWEWFGKGLHKIRYQRHLCDLWKRGLIFGFIARVEAEEALRCTKPGDFLIRFSERCVGQFAVAYVMQDANTSQKKVRHYLVDPDNDVFGAKRTLPDFLGQQPSLKRIVKVKTISEDFSTMASNGQNVLHRHRREFRALDKEVLAEFYSKRNFEKPSGYVVHLGV